MAAGARRRPCAACHAQPPSLPGAHLRVRRMASCSRRIERRWWSSSCHCRAGGCTTQRGTALSHLRNRAKFCANPTLNSHMRSKANPAFCTQLGLPAGTGHAHL